MYNSKQIMKIYNLISDDKINKDSLATILPKLYMILNKVKLDEIEMICVIDTLKELENNDLLDKLNIEIINLINKVVNSEQLNLEGTVYFSEILKHTLMPYNKNICHKDYNLMLFLSEFEIYLELINQRLNKKDLSILDKYNHELTEIILKYKEIQTIYKQVVYHDVMLSSMISHFATLLYFNLDDFDFDYDLIKEVFARIVNKYQAFVDYCCAIGIQKNYTRPINDMENIEIEYLIGYEMLKYVYNDEKEEKIKRK